MIMAGVDPQHMDLLDESVLEEVFAVVQNFDPNVDLTEDDAHFIDQRL